MHAGICDPRHLALRYPSATLRVRVRAGYDFEDQFALVEPEVSYRLWRELRVGLVANIIQDAASNGFDYFDLIRHEDRVGLRMQYFF